MAFRLEREKATSTPYVLIDEEKKYMKLEGRCFHENVAGFFKDVNEWLDAYLASDFDTFTFDCAISYFNSSTTKLLLNMLLKMNKYASETKKVIVNWITTEDNEIMVECGEDFREDMDNLQFNMVIM
ncbi:MAG: DUF1987 domain-containing protein [Fibromonadales bacterium]|nr:DUF1987 domain-containing protein [Fibromonadales bacterium]MCL2261093.1 DUF1987 domain-containing protein [Fibromonadales bacterium]